jgi:hypothetical protein
MLVIAAHSFVAGSYRSTELSRFWPSWPPITYSLPSIAAAAGQVRAVDIGATASQAFFAGSNRSTELR